MEFAHAYISEAQTSQACSCKSELEQAISTPEFHLEILVAVHAWLQVCLSTQVSLQSLTQTRPPESQWESTETYILSLFLYLSPDPSPLLHSAISNLPKPLQLSPGEGWEVAGRCQKRSLCQKRCPLNSQCVGEGLYRTGMFCSLFPGTGWDAGVAGTAWGTQSGEGGGDWNNRGTFTLSQVHVNILPLLAHHSTLPETSKSLQKEIFLLRFLYL